MELKDGLIFESNKSKIIYNKYSFFELLKHIMVKYGNVTYEQANQIVVDTEFLKSKDDYNGVTLIGHELEYHWAMLMLHGSMYWLKGIPSDYNNFSNEYLVWEKEIMKKHNLKCCLEYFDE